MYLADVITKPNRAPVRRTLLLGSATRRSGEFGKARQVAFIHQPN
jgi:hypothetical protein